MSRRRKTLLIFISAVLAGAVTIWLLFLMTPNEPVDESIQTVNKSTNTRAKQLKCVEELPLKQLLGQRLMVAANRSNLDEVRDLIVRFDIGGVVLMQELSAEQISELEDLSDVRLMVAVDQEGGSVQRFTSFGRMPGAEQMTSKYSASQAYQIYLNDYQRLADAGVNTLFAPVVDVESVRGRNPLPGRMYSSDPEQVTLYAKQAILAAEKAGLTPVIKHFPGLGTATGNTDFQTATTAPISELQSRDLVPYRELADPSVDAMVANAIVPGLTGGQPAVWSSAALDLLRSLGYQQSVVYSDSLTAEAIPGDLAQAIMKSWQAGVDVALIVQPDDNTASTVIDRVYRDTKELLETQDATSRSMDSAVLRILERKRVDPCSLTSD